VLVELTVVAAVRNREHTGQADCVADLNLDRQVPDFVECMVEAVEIVFPF